MARFLVTLVVEQEDSQSINKLRELFPASDFTISEVNENDRHIVENFVEMAKLKIENVLKFVSSVVF